MAIFLLKLGNNRAWNVTVEWVSTVIAITGIATGVNVGDFMVETSKFGFKRVGGTSSITAITTTATQGDASITATSSMAFTANTAGQQELFLRYSAPNFVGGGQVEMRISAKVSLVENAW